MCMGCAEAVLMSNEGKTPDTTEATLYFVGFAVWFFLLAGAHGGGECWPVYVGIWLCVC